MSIQVAGSIGAPVGFVTRRVDDFRPGRERFSQLVERLHLHLDRHSRFASELHRRGDAAGSCDVVVLDEDCVPKTVAVVVSPAGTDDGVT